MATKAGRSWFSLPSPYDSQEPMLGRPASWAPVWKKVMAGSWLIASVCNDLMKHSSSATCAVYGSSSLSHAPACPCCRNENRDGAVGKLDCDDVMPVRRWP